MKLVFQNLDTLIFTMVELVKDLIKLQLLELFTCLS